VSRAQYEKLYAGTGYREFSPGETRVNDFRNLVKTTGDDVIIDFGCGTGRAAKQLGAIGLDFVKAIETDIEFHQHDLRKPLPVRGTVGFCTDVMEHIATRDVKRVLKNIMSAVKKCYFQICTVPDEFGGGALHLTVKPFWWWAKRMQEVGLVRYARQEKHHAIFVVGTQTVRELEKRLVLMEPEEVLRKNIIANMEAGYEEARPFQIQQTEVALLAGGPSLEQFDRPDLPIITVNGAYNWAVERGYKPKAQLIVDPRYWNKRFAHPAVEGCKYLIASQCHPGVAQSVPKDQVWLWHSGDVAAPVMRELGEENGHREWMAIFGGSTIMLRAFPLLAMLGLRKFHVWGFDSCLGERGVHHAYAQPENDGDKTMDITVGGRTFVCHPWMAVQAQEYVDLVKHMLPEDLEMVLYGNGLIAHILKTGAVYGGERMAGLLGSEEIHSDGGHRPQHERNCNGVVQDV
jgi:hypothetical protein